MLRTVDLDGTIPADHEARTIWGLVEQLDLSGFYAAIDAREGVAGRNATDPKLLIALWLYATTRGVGSARELARLCESHDAYRWLCGGVTVNHHMLSDFRVGYVEALDDLFTQVLAAMMKQGLVTLTRVAQDGTRIRASAGGGSFRRKATLTKLLTEARAQVEHVKGLADDPTVTAREAAAQQRAAREREERLGRALDELPKIRAAKTNKKKAKPKDLENARASTTDPDARLMKMGDGGFRPAYNLEFASTTKEKVIVGVGVTNMGTDGAQMEPMLEDIEHRTAQTPSEYLVDGGFVNLDAFEQADAQGITVYAPVPKPRKQGVDPHQPKKTDGPAVADWRTRMGTEEAKEIYKQRAETAELPNAVVKERFGLRQLRVRGSAKVLSIAIWVALTYNVSRWLALTAGA